VQHQIGQDLDSPDMPDAVRAECPAWLWPHMEARFGDEVGTAVAALGLEAPFDLRVNPLAGLSREAVIAALAEEQVPAVPTSLSPFGLRLDRRRPVDSMAPFKSGALEVQDEGSQLAALVAGAGPGMLVIDYCAGAGGKALALAAGMQNKGRLILFDVSKGRLDRAAVRLRRAGIHNAERKVLAEGDKSVKRLAGKADRVLVDAPCSGTGTWRRNPDAKWRYGAEDLVELTKTQRTILERAASLVKPGGRVIYVTCSVLRAENEDVVEGFLAESDKFSVLPMAGVWAQAVGDTPCPTSGPYLTLSPHRQGTDGFFVAVLERAIQP
jgi:16S rRNA (cytosine967-C5)-methyltransferase